MQQFTDCFGDMVRLTDERLAHLLDHIEMQGMENEIGEVLSRPQSVRRSSSELSVRLYYDFYAKTTVDGKWLFVVVKYPEADAYIITAYLTDKPKNGVDLWPIK